MLMNNISDIQDYEVPNLVNKLIRFIGHTEIEKCLHRYERALQSSGPIFREYYIRSRHPWWEALLEYFNLERSGKSIRKNLTNRLKILAGDAKRISVLQRFMPERIKEKYKRDLIDDNQAFSYLFEIQIAWHFILKGCEIEWHDDDSTSHSEFLVKEPEFEFNVECKRISVDLSRKVRRKDFYRLAEKILPAIEKEGISGQIDIRLNERLHSSEKYLSDISSQVIEKITNGRLKGSHRMDFGSVDINLEKANGSIIDLNERLQSLYRRKPQNAHGVIFASSRNSEPVDAIEMTIKSEKSDNVLNGIKKTLSEAAGSQLDPKKPGIICSYLEGIEDLTELAQNSGLQIMTNLLLSKEGLEHIAAISYCSEDIINRFDNTETYFNQGLIFSNPYCKFKKAKDYKYLSNVHSEFEYKLSDIIPNRTNGHS